MFSSQPQASTPWAQKSTPFGTPVAQQPAQSVSGAAFGTPGATAFATPNAAMGTPGAAFGTPSAPQGTPSAPWLYTQQSPAPAGAGAVPQGAADALQAHATQSPADQGPVGYIPGYLSRLRGGDRPATSATRGDASPPTREADSSLSFSTRDIPSLAVPSSSPSTRFSSSFFNGDRVSRSPSVARYREGSIFGSGGLRGSRREDVDRSMSLRPVSPQEASPAFASEPFAFGPSLEDDDAPPQETLAEVAAPQGVPGPFSASAGAPAPASATAPAGATATGAAAAGAAAAAPQPTQAPVSQRAVVVFGFPRYLRDSVLGFFASDALMSAQDVDIGAVPAGVPLDVLPAATRLEYAEPLHALHALRRNGEFVAGALVGVRWEDDGMHHVSVEKGLDAPLQGVPVGAAPAAPATPARAAPGAARPAATPAGTPLIGRPIEVVDGSSSVLARPPKSGASTSTTPLRAVANMGESLWKSMSAAPNAPGTAPTTAGAAGAPHPAPHPAPSTSVFGRLADGLFGW